MEIDWLKEFEQKNGRPLRVLHVGNIANNAYLNARYLRKVGVDAHVLSHNYYHIMGSPNWEEATFSGHWGDDHNPNWVNAGLRDFKTPFWFFQGPLGVCVRTIDAIGSERKIEAWLLSQFLSWFIHWRAHLAPLKVVFTNLKKVSKWGNTKFPLYLRRKQPRDEETLEKNHSQPANDKTMGVSDSDRALCREFSQAFPDRLDKLTPTDICFLSGSLNQWKKIFSHYDIVQSYATFPIDALLAGKRPYIAFEHGTLRSVPFEDTSIGRLTSLSYRSANAVIITNCDNRLAADRLCLSNEAFIPHPINEDGHSSVEEIELLKASIQQQLDSDFVILHPARQHWSKERHPDWEKGNDIFIRGFAKFVKEVNPRAGAVFVEWGKMVEDSKKLLSDLTCADRVLWIKPQPNKSLVRYILATDAVADQFYLGAFGSIPGKAMACGKPVLLNLNEEVHQWCFPELPPVANTKTEDDVFFQLKQLYNNLDYRFELGKKGLRWYAKYHSSKVVVDRHLSLYRKVLGCRETQPEKHVTS